MAHQRGLERVVNLTDAVVAIAGTLLVLPLVDIVGEVEKNHVAQALRDNSDKLYAFVLSFVVIARFWMVHHRIFRDITAYVPLLVWANFLWLLGIVFLPFPTELVGARGVHDAIAAQLYVGTLALTATASSLMQLIIIRTPELQHEAVRGSLSIVGSLVSSGTMVIALILVVVVPSVGLWPLLGLFAGDQVTHLINRSRARAAAG